MITLRVEPGAESALEVVREVVAVQSACTPGCRCGAQGTPPLAIASLVGALALHVAGLGDGERARTALNDERNSAADPAPPCSSLRSSSAAGARASRAWSRAHLDEGEDGLHRAAFEGRSGPVGEVRACCVPPRFAIRASAQHGAYAVGVRPSSAGPRAVRGRRWDSSLPHLGVMSLSPVWLPTGCLGGCRPCSSAAHWRRRGFDAEREADDERLTIRPSAGAARCGVRRRPVLHEVRRITQPRAPCGDGLRGTSYAGR